MIEVAYKARSADGGMIEGSMVGETLDDVVRRLRNKQLTILSINEKQKKKGTFLRFAMAKLRRGPRASRMLTFTSQLTLMLETGNSIGESLAALEAQTTEAKLKNIIASIRQGVMSGSTLASALENHPEAFSEVYVNMVRLGEATGGLASVFKRLEVFLEKQAKLSSDIKSASIYPCILVCLALIVVTFLVTFVLPRFVGIFEGSGVVLPVPTRILLGASFVIRNFWYAILAGLAVTVWSIYVYLKSPRGVVLIDRLLIEMPALGELMKFIYTARIMRTLGTLIEAGVPHVDSIEVARQVATRKAFRKLMEDVGQSVLEGLGMAKAFNESALIPPTVKQMVETAESTGTLGRVLLRLADHYDDLTDKKVKLLTAYFEPGIIVTIGLVIGFITASVLLPLFKLTSAVKGGA